MTRSKIIDVSKWQGDIDWADAKSEVALAILRVQDGQSVYDHKLERNVTECHKHNIPFGVYGFFRAGTAAEAVAECKLLISRTKAAGGGALFYVLDCETNDCNKTSIKAAVKYLLEQDVRVGIYFAHHLYATYGGDYGQHFTWIPRYGSRPKYPCDLWQYTSEGSVRGIRGNVDLNVVNDDKTLAWFIQGRTIKPKLPAKKHANPKYQGKLLKNGSKGAAVKKVQQRLRDKGYRIAVDGIFGDKTETAIRSYQRKHRLTIDGIVGADTWGSLW